MAQPARIESMPTTEAFLSVEDLKIQFPTDDGLVRAVDGLTFALQPGKTLGIVGESGSGKSVTSLGIMGLHRAGAGAGAARVTGKIWLDGEELIEASADRVRELRGQKMAMIFQDPLSSLHPFYRVGAQIVEGYRTHHPGTSKQVARKRAIEMLERVGIPEPSKRVDDYPHQFSGGMRQRAMIAMALVNDPSLLIADEPTTALDVTVQAQILDLLRDLQKEFGSAIIIITHDLGVVAEVADDVLVMYGGQAVEHASCDDIFRRPEHPYTWGLLSSMPRLDRERAERLIPVKGSPPSLISLPKGCNFAPRCPYEGLTDGRAATEVPDLLPSIGSRHEVRCHLSPETRQRIWREEVQPAL